MKKFFRKLSLVPRGLRYKLLVVFSLMTIIPLLVAAYLITTYIFPNSDTIIDVSIAFLLTVLIAFLGLVLGRRLVEPVIDMALEARVIASGEFDRKITVEREDEIGELGKAINEMTKTIRSHLEELSTYSERTKQINLDIHKKVVVLSNLLHIGDAITVAKLPLDEILSIAVEKAAQTYESGYAIFLCWEDEEKKVMVAKTSYNVPTDVLKDMRVKEKEGFLGSLIAEPRTWSIDKKTKPSPNVETFLEAYSIKNVAILPVFTRKKLIGFLIIGNQLDDFAYTDDDIETYKVFTTQIAIAIESDYLFKRAKELAIADELTGLYNKKYITTRLEEEIKRAILHQRPCSFVIIDVDDFSKIKNMYKEISIERAIKKIGGILQANVTEIGKAARIGPDVFALLLPEVNKRGATEVSEHIRKSIEKAFSEKVTPEDIKDLTVSVGASENPIDGSTAEALIEKASKAVGIAKSLGKNRVIAHIG